MTTITSLLQVRALQLWLHSLPSDVKLGAALSTNHDLLGIAGSDGTTWGVKVRGRDLVGAVINSVRDSGRRIWVEQATPMTLALSSTAIEPIEGLSMFVCLRVLRKAIDPDLEPVDLSGRSAVFRAREAACEAHRLQLATPQAVRRAALASVATDLIWRSRQQKGWSLDTETLNSLAAAVWDDRKASARRLRIDLCKDDAATLGWITAHHITLGLKKGKPSLSHDEWPTAIVPPESAAAWEAFQAVRDLKSSTDQLRMLTNRMRRGRIFSEIWILGARTGRTTSKNAALQNITKRIRHVFRADPGEVLIGIDIDRAEVALAAVASGDEMLMHDLKAGDPYMALARGVHGEAATAAHRSEFKTAMLAIFFGQGSTATAAKLGITKAAVDTMTATMRARWTMLFELIDETKKAVQREDDRTTFGGRVLPKLTSSESYIAFNHLTQGGSADLFNAGCIRVADALGAALYGGNRAEGAHHLWLPVHDELICSIPADRAHELLDVLEQAMNVEINGVRVGGTATLLGETWRKIE
jgi:hypothetical protein